MKREVDLHPGVWRQIDRCAASHLYGFTFEECMLSLLRPGLLEAHRLGILEPLLRPAKKTKRKTKRQR